MKYNRIFFLSFLIAAFVACSSAPEEVIVTLPQADSVWKYTLIVH